MMPDGDDSRAGRVGRDGNVPPLVVDIDGTLTDDRRRLDPRVIPVLREWAAPVVVATGKSMPYPVALCEFLGLDTLVIAENGGVVLTGRAGDLQIRGDRAAAEAVLSEYRDRGYDLGWGAADLVNRWRETELAVSRDQPLGPLEEIAGDHGLVVLDTGFAYHVTSPDVDKGTGLAAVAEALGHDTSDFAAVGDSENDAPILSAAGRSAAVANADATARAAADHVTAAAYADGFLEAVGWVADGSED
jgi:phosphoglycolate phosphatase (TIGR01487 family)